MFMFNSDADISRMDSNNLSPFISPNASLVRKDPVKRGIEFLSFRYILPLTLVIKNFKKSLFDGISWFLPAQEMFLDSQ